MICGKPWTDKAERERTPASTFCPCKESEFRRYKGASVRVEEGAGEGETAMPKMSESRRKEEKKTVENGEVVQTENECSGLLSAGGGQKKQKGDDDRKGNQLGREVGL